ncbi:translation initiation factor IF-3 [Proteiniborus sp. MB09-C3]|uniref:translation initiation factor IF-3 n=1 Tax=Proteiniborus sp. MB09-C3 TaxID=3050072 RepID=UPI002552497A|nr:translation initiation factor IF-3 [Proteiniborus sp. MB09-C3]WIV11410.1 translation initiation factor IF-3 [Proteiniborus sp. MB09-C3]
MFRRCLNIKELQVNEEIREKEIRLIDVNGEQLGIMSSKKAMEVADDRKLDLVMIAPNAKPPVCRIMDYGKYKYELAKREKEARKNQKVITIKEIRLTPTIEANDLNVKAKRAIDFLKDEDKVKVTVRFRGREMGHTEKGEVVLKKFAEITSEYGVIDKQPKLEGRNMVMYLNPKN